MYKKTLLLSLGVLFLFSPLTLHAAPFCAVMSYGKSCRYYDYDACLDAAGSDGACVVNQEDVMAPSGLSFPFCVVNSYGTHCIYRDAGSCRRAAASDSGACIVNPNSR
jgi:hypothetical protein